MPILLSVVFVTHGDRIEVVKRLIESVEGYGPEGWVEFICVDNGSVPSSSDFIDGRFPFVTRIRNAENLGTSRAYNAGIRKASGEFVMIINDDTVVPAGMLEAIRGRLQDETARDGIALGLKRSESEFQALRLKILNTSKRHPRRPVRATFAGTGNLVIRRAVLERVGLYDENYFAGNEDMDLSLRLKRAGAVLLYYPDLFIYHVHVYRSKKGAWPDFILARRLSDIYYAQKFFPLLAPLARLYALRNFGKRFKGRVSPDTLRRARTILLTRRDTYYEVQKSLVRDGIGGAFERYCARSD